MKKVLTIVALIVLLLPSSSVWADGRENVPRKHKRLHDTMVRVEALYSARLDSLIRRNRDTLRTDTADVPSPYLYRLFSPTTLFGRSVHTTLGTLAPSAAPRGSRREAVLAADEMLLRLYAAQPSLITSDDDVQDVPKKRGDAAKEVRPEVKMAEKAAPEILPDQTLGDDWTIAVKKPNFWKVTASGSLQLMQAHISDNWYKGGESNYSWLVQGTVNATYNNKQKVVFSNVLEAKLGFFSTKGDNLHKFRSNSDLIRLTNKLGLRATKHWYYTLLLQSWSQFYPGYKSNDAKVYSDFMSPFESVLSFGMDYNLSLKRFTASATISPLAVDFKYVDRRYLATSFGIDEGHKHRWSFGSNITVKYQWKIINNVTWDSRIYFYTDYTKALIEWENTFNMKINKYLSTKLFLYPRFDDSAKRKEGKSYIQFKENLSFGLDVSF